MYEAPSGRLKTYPYPSHPISTYTCGVTTTPKVRNSVAHVYWHLEIDQYDWMGSAMYCLGVQMNPWASNCFFKYIIYLFTFI